MKATIKLYSLEIHDYEPLNSHTISSGLGIAYLNQISLDRKRSHIIVKNQYGKEQDIFIWEKTYILDYKGTIEDFKEYMGGIIDANIREFARLALIPERDQPSDAIYNLPDYLDQIMQLIHLVYPEGEPENLHKSWWGILTEPVKAFNRCEELDTTYLNWGESIAANDGSFEVWLNLYPTAKKSIYFIREYQEEGYTGITIHDN